MGKKIYITEEQYKNIVREGVLPNGKTEISINQNDIDKSGSFDNAVKDIKGNLQKSFSASNSKIDNSIEFSAPAHMVKNPSKKDKIVSNDQSTTNDSNTGVFESKLITKEELCKNRLKVLKENSTLYTIKDFINKIDK
jgi:hypothetical protein